MNIMKSFLRKILPPSFILWTHKIRAILAAVYFRFPANKMTVIGVTGTNGKTTTCNLIAEILETAGYKVCLATTINFKILQHSWVNKTKMTTLSPFELQKFLKLALEAGCEYAVIETTSHAIIQSRIWGIPYDVAVFTNLTHEHLDYHKNITEYRNAKGLLFDSLSKSLRKPGVKKISVINLDDPSAGYFSKFLADKKYYYRVGGAASQAKNNEILARRIHQDVEGSAFTVDVPDKAFDVRLNLPGKFNISNALAAITVGFSQNVAPENIKKALEKVKGIPGRMEKIAVGQPFSVIVDFAHTPDALKKIFQTIKPVVKGKIIAIFGATGERDTSKRPIMGALASQYADVVIVTSDDPYHEDPQQIVDQVALGVPKGAPKENPKIEGENFFKIIDRRQAIEKGLKMAKKDDLVLIMGKGAEQFQVIGDKKIPWDDRKVVRQILENMSYHK